MEEGAKFTSFKVQRTELLNEVSEDPYVPYLCALLMCPTYVPYLCALLMCPTYVPYLCVNLCIKSGVDNLQDDLNA
jgi:hypothetical protein